MNIILAGHAPWRPTGYGVQTKLSTEIFKALGHQVTLLVVDSHGPGVIEWHGFDAYLPNRDRWGLDIIGTLCQITNSDLVISIFDPWVLPMEGYRVAGRDWIGWFPVDQRPMPYHLTGQLEHMTQCVALSTFGLNVMLSEKPKLMERFHAIPAPVDVSKFSLGDRQEARKILGLPENAKVAGIVAANIAGDRKALAEQVEGWCIWAKSSGVQDARLLIHSDPFGAVNLAALLDQYGCRDMALFTSEWARAYGFSSHEQLAILYRAMDVLLHASAAEGFGLCIAEAMACGTPVIINNTTSMPETSGNGHGRVIIGSDYQNKVWSPYGGWWSRPTAKGVAWALENFFTYDAQLYQNYESRVRVREEALRFAPERIGEQWSKILA